MITLATSEDVVVQNAVKMFQCSLPLLEGSEAPIRVNGDLQVRPPPPPARQTVATGGGVGGAGVSGMVVTSSASDSNPPQLAPMAAPTRLNNNQGIIEMLDVGALAPQNATCALCDRHDYLHRTDLPNYLTCPCYHCRESLARDAKITPEDLFDLHLQVSNLFILAALMRVFLAVLHGRGNLSPVLSQHQIN